MIKIKRKILIAMSGGVDSSVAAYLLKKRGFEVVGVFLNLQSNTKSTEIRRIKKVAKKLNIPLTIIDARKEFRKKVIDYFLREYKEGRTPNPCAVCNREIKFKFLFDELLKLKADYITTGHYARIISNFQFPTRLPASQRGEPARQVSNKIPKSKLPITNYQLQNYHLFSAKDKTKDQSYFLYTLKQKQLAKILFPLGNYKKEEIKKIAGNLKLPVNEEESQSACFIAEKWPDEFLKKNLKMKSGNITDINGNIIGRHIGLPLYTIGQRRNIRIGGTGPYYVVAKNFRKNLLIVVKRPNNPLLFQKSLFVKKVNWLAGEPKFPLQTRVCIRYHHPAVRAIMKKAESYLPRRLASLRSGQAGKPKAKSCLVEFAKPQRAVTPGQAAVIYSEKGEVLGGGVIK